MLQNGEEAGFEYPEFEQVYEMLCIEVIRNTLCMSNSTSRLTKRVQEDSRLSHYFQYALQITRLKTGI